MKELNSKIFLNILLLFAVPDCHVSALTTAAATETSEYLTAHCDNDEYTLDNRTGSCYKFHRVPLTFPEALLTCETEGGHLAIINSEAEVQVLREIYETYTKNKLAFAFASIINIHWLRDQALFMGYTSWVQNGAFSTIHGQSLKDAGYDKFNEGEPNNASGKQYCIAMLRNGLLDDIECDQKLAYICEKKPTQYH